MSLRTRRAQRAGFERLLEYDGPVGATVDCKVCGGQKVREKVSEDTVLAYFMQNFDMFELRNPRVGDRVLHIEEGWFGKCIGFADAATLESMHPVVFSESGAEIQSHHAQRYRVIKATASLPQRPWME